jgi:hypothetical protein
VRDRPGFIVSAIFVNAAIRRGEFGRIFVSRLGRASLMLCAYYVAIEFSRYLAMEALAAPLIAAF